LVLSKRLFFFRKIKFGCSLPQATGIEIVLPDFFSIEQTPIFFRKIKFGCSLPQATD